MREIKFRALAAVNDKHSGIKKCDMVYGQFIQSGVDVPCIIFGDGEQIEIDRKTLGQLTGLEDKNGKDIYEGDLITNGSGRIGRVLWHDISGSWDSEAQSPDGTHVGFNTFHWKDMIEVIGNIHQHPELIGGNNNESI